MHHSVTRRRRAYPIDISDVPAESPTFEGTDVPVEYLFRYWDMRFALKSFLSDFPEVSSTQALETLRKRAKSDIPADSTDGLMGGMWSTTVILAALRQLLWPLWVRCNCRL